MFLSLVLFYNIFGPQNFGDDPLVLKVYGLALYGALLADIQCRPGRTDPQPIPKRHSGPHEADESAWH